MNYRASDEINVRFAENNDPNCECMCSAMCQNCTEAMSAASQVTTSPRGPSPTSLYTEPWATCIDY